MVTINNTAFYDKPGSCGTCPFFTNGASRFCNVSKGYCRMFDEMHHSYINPPQRCQKLFNKAFRMPDGSNLAIVVKDE